MIAQSSSHGSHPISHAGRSFTKTFTNTMLVAYRRRWCIIASGLAVLSTASCSAPTVDNSAVEKQLRARIAAQQAEIKRLRLDVAIEKAHVDALKEVYIPDNLAEANAMARRRVEPATPAPKAVAMCFKDYCPCEEPQGGPDSVLCDQLEQGIEPDIQMMIAGRGMREARQQLETGDY